jgi:phospholipid transport system substrate-binding protein
MISRRSLLQSALAGAVFCAAGLPSRAAEADPRAFVDHLATQAMDTMVAKGVSDAERTARFRTLFTNAVDMPELAKFVLGRYWRTATPEQQQEFLKLFEDILVLTWANRFKDYAGGVQHQVTGATPDGERGVFVESRVSREKQEPISLQWRLRQPDGGFKVVDLIVEGSSMAITYRSEYASVIQSSGGKVDGLLNAMRKKIAQLQADPSLAGTGARAN